MKTLEEMEKTMGSAANIFRSDPRWLAAVAISNPALSFLYSCLSLVIIHRHASLVLTRYLLERLSRAPSE